MAFFNIHFFIFYSSWLCVWCGAGWVWKHIFAISFFPTFHFIFLSSISLWLNYKLSEHSGLNFFGENSFQCWLGSEPLYRHHVPWAVREVPQAPSTKLHSASQHQTTIALNCVYKHLCFILTCASIRKMCSKIIASLLSTISAYKGMLCFQIVGESITWII